MRENEGRLLSWPERFLIYGVAGIAAEVCFTATWEAIENGNRKLVGVSSMYVFFVYGMALFMIERLSLLLKGRLPLFLRGIVYVVVTYKTELSLGMLLKQADACPWDYSTYFNNHFLGLITPNYIPVWFAAALFAEKVLIHSALSLSWPPHEKQL